MSEAHFANELRDYATRLRAIRTADPVAARTLETIARDMRRRALELGGAFLSDGRVITISDRRYRVQEPRGHFSL